MHNRLASSIRNTLGKYMSSSRVVGDAQKVNYDHVRQISIFTFWISFNVSVVCYYLLEAISFFSEERI